MPVLTVKQNEPVTQSKHEVTRQKENKKQEMTTHCLFLECCRII